MSDILGIEGRWQIVRAELEGDLMPEFAARQTEIELAGGAYTVRFAGETKDRGTYVLATSTAFKQITFFGTEGTNVDRTIPAIYQLVGDRLRICYGLDGTRPAAFTSTLGASLFLVTYRRVSSDTDVEPSGDGG